MSVTYNYPPLNATLTGGATEAKQDVIITNQESQIAEAEAQTAELQDINSELNTQTTALSDINSELNTQTTALNGLLTDTQLRATPVPVSVSSSALPTGAATEATLSGISSKLPATLGQKTSAASLAVTLSSDQPAVPISFNSVISTANSSTSVLAGGAVFTGTSEAVQNYASIEVNVFSSHASAASGLSVQQSSNGTNWDIVDTYTIPATTGKTFSFAPAAAFFRIVYTNGATLQTAFRLQTVYHFSAVRSSTHSLAETISNQNDAELVIAQLRGSDGTNAVPVLVDASGRPASNIAQINGVTPLMGNGVTGTGSLRVTLASDTSSNTNPLLVQVARTATSTLSNVASSASSVSLLASNTNRKVAMIFNDSTAILYVKFGTTASTSSYTVQIAAGGYYEFPGPTIYTGAVDGIWASANGNARITEVT